MFESFILGISSVIPSLNTVEPPLDLTQAFFEEKIIIPQGVSKITTTQPWNAMTMFSHEGNDLPKIYYQKDQTFQPWHATEDEKGHAIHSALDLLFAGETRYELIIKSETQTEVVAHFFNTKRKGENSVAFAPLDDDSFDDKKTGLAKYVKKPRYISRAEWGADESLRVWKPSLGISSFFRKTVPETKWAPKYMHPSGVQAKNKDNKKLIWPIESNKQVKKIIVHHTGEYVDEKRNPRELMRAIYYYHTLTRGWGDIGYNYIIDKQGNIYEGRYGGPNTVGAHVAFYNLGTIGVSLMGNFNNEQPTVAQQKILTLIIADHANRFAINPLGSSKFLDILSKNIAGHRDVTRKGHGTACPGTNLYNLLPKIRKDATALMPMLNKGNIKVSRDFLQKSKIAPNFTKAEEITFKTKKNKTIYLGSNLKQVDLYRNTNKIVEITVHNGTNHPWPKNSVIQTKNTPSGVTFTNLKSIEPIYAGRKGIFRGKITVNSTPNGKFNVTLHPAIKTKNKEVNTAVFNFPIQISGEKLSARNINKFAKTRKIASNNVSIKNRMPLGANLLGSNSYKKAVKKIDHGKDVKVKIAFFDKKYAVISGDKAIKIYDSGKYIKTIKAKTPIKLIPIDSKKIFQVLINNDQKTSFYIRTPKLISDKGILKIHNYNRGLGKTAYNRFRNQLNFHLKQGSKNFIVVNKLPIEQYLYGLAEEPSHEPLEKKHAVYILARSYMYVYSGTKRKFKTFQYDLEDDPRTSQYYLGYDWEHYHSDQVKLIDKTRGKVITHNNVPIIGPYFTQSSGASSSKWSKQYPWTYARELPYDKGLEPKGHGVGLSGNSSRVLAEKGKNYIEILNYFYKGISVKKVY